MNQYLSHSTLINCFNGGNKNERIYKESHKK